MVFLNIHTLGEQNKDINNQQIMAHHYFKIQRTNEISLMITLRFYN